MKRLENHTGHLPGMFCLALVFSARFCDYSATRFWNCKAGYVGADQWVVMFQSVFSLLWKRHVLKQDHLGLGDNGRAPFDEKENDQESIRPIFFEFTFFLSTVLPGDLYCFCINAFEPTLSVMGFLAKLVVYLPRFCPFWVPDQSSFQAFPNVRSLRKQVWSPKVSNHF